MTCFNFTWWIIRPFISYIGCIWISGSRMKLVTTAQVTSSSQHGENTVKNTRSFSYLILGPVKTNPAPVGVVSCVEVWSPHNKLSESASTSPHARYTDTFLWCCSFNVGFGSKQFEANHTHRTWRRREVQFIENYVNQKHPRCSFHSSIRFLSCR